MDGTYPKSLWTGIMQKAAQEGVNVLMVPGGGFNPQNHRDFQESLMYKLLASPRIDGFVITATAFNKFRTSKWVYDFFNQFNKPYTSIGVELFTVPSSLIENTEGLNRLFDHFMGDHGYKKVAFIRGPENNDEAETRFRCYREALKKYNLPFDEKLVAVGTFNQDSGDVAMKQILDAADGHPDAVVAANDYMAIGAFEVLKQRHINVPQECAVGGFDNVFESGFLESPLTTVVQPFEKQAAEALEMLLEMLNGRQNITNRTNHTEIMIRNSCGCLSRTIRAISAADTGSNRTETLNADMINELFPEQLQNAYDTNKTSNNLFDLFTHEPFDRELEEVILHEFERIFSALMSENIGMHIWTGCLTKLYHMLAATKGLKTREGSEFFQKLRVLIAEYGQRAMVMEQTRLSGQFNVLRSVLLNLVSSFNMDVLTENIGQSLPMLGFPSFFVLRYARDKILTDEDSVFLPEQAVLQLAYYRESDGLKNEEVRYNTIDILPEGYFPEDRNYAYLVRPLFFENTHFGLMLTEIGPRNMMIHESIRNQISGALKAAQTNTENKRREQEAIVKRDNIQKLVEPIIVSLQEVSRLAIDRTSLMRELSVSAQNSSKVVDQSREVISQMNENAKSIQGMIKGVLDISEQIHLLSINTSIEATKAGTHGRGFTVIAQEIKKLAHATAENIENIEQNLEIFVKSIGLSKKASENSGQTYNTMINDVEQAAISLENISSKMEDLMEKSRGIMDVMKN